MSIDSQKLQSNYLRCAISMQIIEDQKKRKICGFRETRINRFFLLKFNFVEKILLEKEKSEKGKKKKTSHKNKKRENGNNTGS